MTTKVQDAQTGAWVDMTITREAYGCTVEIGNFTLLVDVSGHNVRLYRYVDGEDEPEHIDEFKYRDDPPDNSPPLVYPD